MCQAESWLREGGTQTGTMPVAAAAPASPAGDADAESSPLLVGGGTDTQQAATDPGELPWRAGWGWLRAALVLSGAFFFQFTAWHATQNLQSTLPLHPSVSGTAALGIVYLTHCVSGPFSPAVVHALGARRCVVVGMLCYGSFIAAQLHPRPWTIYTGAALVGTAASPLWAAQGLLITHLAVGFAEARRSPDATSATGTFNGLFECAYGALTNIVGSVLSSLAFTYGEHAPAAEGEAGAQPQPAESTVRWLFTLFLAFLFAGVAMIVFGLPARYSTPPPPATRRSLLTTLRLLRERRLYMILPLAVSSGLLSGLTIADFTRSVIVPSLGFDSIGFVLAINGTAGAIGFLILGRVCDVCGRSAVVAVGLCGFGTMICSLLWLPVPPAGAWLTVCALGAAGSVGNASMTVAIVAYLSASFLDGKTAEAFANKCADSYRARLALAPSALLGQSLPVGLWQVLRGLRSAGGGVLRLGRCRSAAQAHRLFKRARAGLRLLLLCRVRGPTPQAEGHLTQVVAKPRLSHVMYMSRGSAKTAAGGEPVRSGGR